MSEQDRIDPGRTALIAYDVCRRALTPADPARRAAMRPVLDAWVRVIAAPAGRRAGHLHHAGQPSRWRRRRACCRPICRRRPVCRRSPTPSKAAQDAGFPDEIAPRPEDYVFLKRRPSAFYGTGVAELLRMLRRDTIIIGGGATNRGVEPACVRLQSGSRTIVVRECCWGGDAAAHAYSLDKAMKMYARIRHLDQVVAMLR